MLRGGKSFGIARHWHPVLKTYMIPFITSRTSTWRLLPPRSTVHDYLDLWSYDGTLDRIHHALYVECREQGEREASPTAAIIDSQSVKSAEKGGPVSIRRRVSPMEEDSIQRVID